MTSVKNNQEHDFQSALPDTTSTFSVDGLHGPVTIVRDQYGIPHAQTNSVHDAFFAQGFMTAQDRLWQMEYDRRRAYGRWAEYAGPSVIAQDITMRRFQIGQSVQEDYRELNTETREMLVAYTEGVNAFITTTKSLPIEYQLVGGAPDPWLPQDCLAVFKVRHILMGSFEGKLWRARLLKYLGADNAARLLPGYQPGHLVIVPPKGVFDGPIANALEEMGKSLEAINWMDVPDSGSNNWVVSGDRTASGKPLLAGDPHRPLDVANVYYQNHISCPEFDVIGLSFPGMPGFPHFGHNSDVAWCVTHAMADYQDLYLERFQDGNPTTYEFKGEWKPATIRSEQIAVRGGDPVEVSVTVTHHGPVIAGDPSTGYGIAFRYTATSGANHGAEALLPMLRTKTVDELEDTMRVWVDPCNNFAFADIQGNIGYLTRGQIPVRPMANAWLPVPGWSGEYEWDGFIPFESLPRVRNPENGYIVTANNRIPSSDYPYYINLDFAPEFRARRILDRLEALQKATVADMASIHGDRLSIPNRRYAHLLAKAPVDHPLAERVQHLLANWDGVMRPDTIEPTVIAATRTHLDRLILAPLLGDLAEEAFTASGRGGAAHLGRLSMLLLEATNSPDSWMLPPETGWEAMLGKALHSGLTYLTDRLGADVSNWTWGAVHATRPRHTLSESVPALSSLLDPPSIEMGGGGETPHAAGYSPSDLFTVTGLSVARYVFDLADWNASRWVIPLGSSGHPGSAHYADQAPIWGNIELIPMLYTWDRITSEGESSQVLQPQ